MYTSPEDSEILVMSPFPEEDDFSYFCKYDELTGVVACPGIYLPTVEQSCFVSRADVFGNQRV